MRMDEIVRIYPFLIIGKKSKAKEKLIVLFTVSGTQINIIVG